MLDLEARCVVNEILEYFFLKSCEIAWVLVFRRHHLGFRCSWQNKRFDRVLKREIGNKRVFSYKIPLPEKVILGLFFSFRNKLT